MAFCGFCQRLFQDDDSLYRHLKNSSRHVWCDRCSKVFNSETAKQQHTHNSSRHNVCPRYPCDADFETEGQLELHNCMDNSGTGSDISSDTLFREEIPVEYLGLDRSVIAPVFAFAVRHRRQKPTVDVIIRRTKTALDNAIVSALLAAALRMLPADKTPQGVAKRIVRQAEAKSAEDAFVAGFDRLAYDYVTEDEQKGLSTMTPDIRFSKLTLVCGHPCLWLEYKDFFGFRANPYVARSNKKQFRRYANEIGPGAVIYKLGFETGHFDIEGVRLFHEKEVGRYLISERNRDR